MTSEATSRAVLIEYHVTADAIFVFGVLPGQAEPEIVSIEMARAEMRDLVKSVQMTVAREPLALAERLADPRLLRLVDPIGKWVDVGELVYLVPHDALHRLPLHALSVDGVPLVERNPVVFVPSASALRYCLAKRRERRATALVVADPPEEVPLVFTRVQALAVADYFGQTDLITGAAATRAELTERLAAGSPDVLHFATHGVFDADDPMRSGVELADGRFTAADFLQLSLDVDLVTLGACETGLSGRQPGDELVGLTRALLYAGAPSVLVTLWRVDELSTSLLLTKFYAGLHAGASKVDALRDACAWLRGRTIADVLDYAREARARPGLDDATATAIDLEMARLHLAGRNFAEAAALYQSLLDRPGATTWQAEAAETGALQARLLRDAAEPDLTRRIFDDPYHWAPFALVGDWL